MEKYNIYGLKINIDDDKLLNPILKNRLKKSKWEEQEAKSVKYISQDACVLELGGCLGIISLLINKKLNNPQKHVVLEVDPKLIPFMEKIKADNDGQYKIENTFLSTSEDVQTVSIHPTHIMGSHLGKKHGFKTIECKGVTVSALEKKYNIIFDTIIMDIEGGEYKLYKDGFFSKENMKNIKFLMIELHQHTKKASLRKYLNLSFDKCRNIKHTTDNTVLIFENENEN